MIAELDARRLAPVTKIRISPLEPAPCLLLDDASAAGSVSQISWRRSVREPIAGTVSLCLNDDARARSFPMIGLRNNQHLVPTATDELPERD